MRSKLNSPVQIRWKRGLSSGVTQDFKKSVNSSIRELSEFILTSSNSKLDLKIYIYPFYNLPDVSGDLDSLVGLTLVDESKIYLNYDLIKSKLNPSSEIDNHFLEIILVHELLHATVQDKIHHSLKWARCVLSTWKNILTSVPKWQVHSWAKFKEFVLQDLRNNMSKSKYLKAIVDA